MPAKRRENANLGKLLVPDRKPTIFATETAEGAELR